MKLKASTFAGAFLHGYALGVLTGCFGTAAFVGTFMVFAK